MTLPNPLRRRKVRLALVLGLAMVAAVIAWRSVPARNEPTCVAGRQEERDAKGGLVRITRTECIR